MIPADHFHDNGDGTALVVVGDGDCLAARTQVIQEWKQANRPCDTCNGHGFVKWADDPCVDCDCTGRHTFDVEVECSNCDEGTCVTILSDGVEVYGCPVCIEGKRTLRVHVIDVLPLVAIDRHNTIGHYIVQTQPSGRWWELDNTDFPIKHHGDSDIVLPSAAKPGMWLVRLEVHS